jgi:hypothetical protein
MNKLFKNLEMELLRKVQENIVLFLNQNYLMKILGRKLEIPYLILEKKKIVILIV